MALLWSCLAFLFLLAAPVFAQSSTPTPTLSLSLTTSTTTVTTTIHTGNRDVTTTTAIPTTFNVTVTVTPTSDPSATQTAAPDYTKLDTHVDPAFGVLGAILILTGLPSAFLGHKNRWTSFFLIGFYTLSLVCFVLILRFGVIQAINPPSTTIRGLFVLSCGVAGIAGGGIAIFFWKAAKYFIGAWGGFALALWIQCLHNGGLIGPLGFRWIMYIGVAVVGFVLCTIPKLHYYVLLLSTAFVGATAFMLGVDCFTTAGLKEFYVWNIGFETIFHKYQDHGIKFPVTQIMQIELGMMGAVSIMGIAVQFQILNILMRKMKEIEEERKRENKEAETRAAERFRSLEAEKDEWEHMHPALAKHGRANSNISGTPLLNKEGSPTVDHESPMNSPRPRYQSGLSEFMAAPTPADDLNRAASKQLQTPGALPVLDLGGDIEKNVPDTFIARNGDSSRSGASKATAAEIEGLKKREELLSEIQTIRRSLDVLRGDSPVPAPSSTADSRHPSTASRPLSQDLSAYLSGAPVAHLRPPRERDPRARIQSMELSTLSRDLGSSIGRPTSAPLRDDDWNLYLQERKLLQPPSGVSPPIPTTPFTPPIPVSPAVMEALKDRQQRESAISGQHVAGSKASSSADEEIPLASRPPHKRSHSQGGSIPVTILPPKRTIAQPTPKAADSSRVKTFEELVERHREKLRELQAPLTQAEKEQADISEARNRWERAKNMEKQAVERRQAEKEQAVKERTRRSGDSPRLGRRTASGEDANAKPGHRRSLSAELLSNIPGAQSSSKRMSTLKVEDWQRHQQDADDESLRPARGRGQSSTMPRRQSGVPFPESSRERERRRMSGFPRDPVS